MALSPEIVRLVYVSIPILSALVGLSLASWVFTTYRGRSDADWFVSMLLASVGWSLATVGHLSSTGWETQLLFRYAAEVTGLTALTLYSVFVSAYTGRNFHRRPVFRVLLVVILGGGYALVATGPFHTLLYSDVVLRTDPFTYLETTYAVGYAPPAILMLVLTCYSTFVLALHIVSTARETGTQLVLFLLGSALMGAITLLGTTPLVPADGLNHAVYGLLPFCVLVAISLFRIRLFDVQPVARNTIVENLTDPILILDSTRRIVDYNHASVALWPTLSDRVGEPLCALESTFVEGLEFPTSGRRETTHQRVGSVDGTTRHYSVTVTRIERRNRGGVGWYALLLRDVTSIERSRQQLEFQNDRLDQVASTISHDLKNPIQVASGYLDLLETDLEALASDGEPTRLAQAHAHLEATSNSVDRMAEIVEEVLTLAREGKTVDETEPVDFGATAREAWGNVDTMDATLAVESDGTLEADRSRLLSIFENCFRNAVEHGSSKASVTVGLTPSEFFVADDGPGIPADASDAVFEHGYTATEGGTGFGLSIVKTMAESHGWAVSVDPDYDAGARLVFDRTAGDPAVGTEGT